MRDERLAAARHTVVSVRVMGVHVTRALARARLLPVVALAAVTLAACSRDEPQPSGAVDLAATATPAVTATSSPRPTAAVGTPATSATATPEATAAPFDEIRSDPVFVHHDPSVRTGVEAVDFVIEAMLAREPERLVKRITGWEQRACFANWSGGFPSPPTCLEGVADGTLIESLFVVAGEGGYLRRDQVAEFARLADGWGLYSVRARRPDPERPDIDYIVIFGSPPGNGTNLLTKSLTVTVEDVTRISGDFSGGLAEVWSTLGAGGGSASPLLAATTLPRNELFPNSGARRVGLDEIDAMIQTVLLRDSKGLELLVALTEVECATELGIGAPPSCERLGLRPGTLVATLPASQCEGLYITRQELRDALSQSFGELSPELAFFGVFQAARGQWRDLPRPDYVIMFRPTGDLERIGYRALHMLDGRIVLLEGGCGAPLPRDEEVARWLIRPVPLE